MDPSGTSLTDLANCPCAGGVADDFRSDAGKFSCKTLVCARLQMRSGNPESLVIPSHVLVQSALGRFWLSECTVSSSSSSSFCGRTMILHREFRSRDSLGKQSQSWAAEQLHEPKDAVFST